MQSHVHLSKYSNNVRACSCGMLAPPWPSAHAQTCTTCLAHGPPWTHLLCTCPLPPGARHDRHALIDAGDIHIHARHGSRSRSTLPCRHALAPGADAGECMTGGRSDLSFSSASQARACPGGRGVMKMSNAAQPGFQSAPKSGGEASLRPGLPS